MTIGISFAEFVGRFYSSNDVYLKLEDSPEIIARGEIIKSDIVEMRFDYPLLFDCTHLRGRLCCFRKETAGLVQYACRVLITAFSKTKLKTRITLVDAETQIEIEPTEQNAILILEQIAKMEELKSASQKV
jgi:hypothetical protein